MRIATCLLLYISATSAQLLPAVPAVNAAVPLIPPIGPNVPPVSPNLLPFSPTPRPLAPGYNNPYYDPASGPVVPILSYSSELGGDGAYSFSFTTADGKQAQESGYLKDAYIDNAGEPQGTQVVQGSYAYIAPDGTPIQVSYIADENGFRPSSIQIPADGKALPPVPQLIDPKLGTAISSLNRFDPYNRNQYDPKYRNPYNNSYRNPYDPTYRNPYDRGYRNPYDPNYRNPYDRSYRNPYDPNYRNLSDPRYRIPYDSNYRNFYKQNSRTAYDPNYRNPYDPYKPDNQRYPYESTRYNPSNPYLPPFAGYDKNAKAIAPKRE